MSGPIPLGDPLGALGGEAVNIRIELNGVSAALAMYVEPFLSSEFPDLYIGGRLKGVNKFCAPGRTGADAKAASAALVSVCSRVR